MGNGDTPTDRLVFPIVNGDHSYLKWSSAEINGMLLDKEASILECQQTAMVISYQEASAPSNKEICRECQAREGGRWVPAETAIGQETGQETHHGLFKVGEHKETLVLGRGTCYLRVKTNTTHKHRPTIPCQAVVSSHLSGINRVDCVGVC